MGVGIPPEIIAAIALVAVGIWAGEGVVKGTKAVAHKTKCGVERIVGKHCDEPKKQ